MGDAAAAGGAGGVQAFCLRPPLDGLCGLVIVLKLIGLPGLLRLRRIVLVGGFGLCGCSWSWWLRLPACLHGFCHHRGHQCRGLPIFLRDLLTRPVFDCCEFGCTSILLQPLVCARRLQHRRRLRASVVGFSSVGGLGIVGCGVLFGLSSWHTL